MDLHELKAEWLVTKDKSAFVTSLGVTPYVRGEKNYSPRHPVTGRPSRATYATKKAAAIEQLDWLLSMV